MPLFSHKLASLRHVIIARSLSTSRVLSARPPRFYNPNDVAVIDDVISAAEETQLVRDLDAGVMPPTKAYESSHFDQVITNYRETQVKDLALLSPSSREVIARVQQILRRTFPDKTEWMAPHVIDLQPETGRIDRHVDSVKYGGAIVAVLSLLASRRMRLTDEPGYDPDVWVDVVIPRRSLYWIKDDARYKMAHAINPGPERRISLVFRDEPPPPPWLAKRLAQQQSHTGGKRV